ncbi:MAG TPA: right-handed parallel beta-helix repeat-containing protein [Longimicrobium sp.]|nr:right-handed parallel beta-helix repeat-containing protein [Longimicrobium sp.]
MSASSENGKPPSLLQFELSPPEAVQRFREAARQALEAEGELSPALRATLAERARAGGVHRYDEALALREVLTLESVRAAFAAAAERRFDGARLEAALRATKPGGELVLERGTYRLDGPLVVSRSITLRGEGRDRTHVVCASGECVLRVEADGPVVVHGISFEHQGAAPADVVVVSAGAARLEECRFTGAAADTLGKRGRGLALFSAGPVEVVSCLAVGNRRTGIQVDEAARATVRDSYAAENGGSGIAFHGNAAGAAANNTCERNALHGIAAAGWAQVTLEGNVCVYNERSGIDFSGSAEGSVQENSCTDNGKDGIRVGGDTRPALARNRCTANRTSGMAFMENARAEARENQCSGNQRHGITVERRASPVLERNRCEENRGAGIGFQGSARGTARGNHCLRNAADGILVDGRAAPTLEENECASNRDCGIRWAGTSRGIARGNRCERNLYGISIGARSAPDAGGDNICQENRYSDWFDARGAAR